MSEQKKAPSLFDNVQPRTSIKVLQQNQRDYIARNKVWGIAIISFLMGCVLATTSTWLLLPRSNSSLDQTIPFDSSPALVNVEPDTTLSSHGTSAEHIETVEPRLDSKTASNNQKNPLSVFNEEQATKATIPANPSNPFKVLEKDSSTAKSKKPTTKQPTTKQQEESVENRSNEQNKTKKDKTATAETKKESESTKQQNSTQKNIKNKKETSVAANGNKKTEAKQPPKKQPTKPDAIEELIKKL